MIVCGNAIRDKWIHGDKLWEDKDVLVCYALCSVLTISVFCSKGYTSFHG